MNDIEVSSIDLVEGGNVFKQGHYLTLGYVPRDEKGETVDLSGKTLNVSLWGRKGVVFEAAATYSGGVIRFTLDKMVPAGDYTVEFTVTSSTDAKYRKKFPTNQHSGRIAIKQSADDLGVIGISVYTVAQFQQLFDEAVGAVTEDSEVILARDGEALLGTRLTKDKQELIARLADKAGQEELNGLSLQISSKAEKSLVDYVNGKTKLNGHVRYGYLWIPEDFPFALPFDLYRNRNGNIQHTFDINTLKVGENLYVNERTGDDAKDGLTPATAVRGLGVAIDKANAGAADNYVINITSHILSRNYFPSARDIAKNIFIRPDNPKNELVIANSEYHTALSWSADGAAYKTGRTATIFVNDLKKRNIYGMPIEYKKVSSISAVQAEKGTWYTDGTSVWIRRIDDSAPDDQVLLLLAAGRMDWTLTGKTLTFVDTVFLKTSANNTSINGFRVIGSGNSRLFLHNCNVKYGTSNGVSLVGVKEAYLFNVSTNDNAADGFNYHGDGSEFVFEYNCQAFNNGVVGGNGTYNATTAHDGMSILRVGTVGFDCYGPLLADVNGCYSLNYDCNMSDSLKATGATKTAFYFDEAGTTKQGKAYLINCGGGGFDTWSINSDGLVDIYVQKFNGSAIPETLALNYI